jgi:hypothetical protein
MNGDEVGDRPPWYKSKPWHVSLAVFGLVAFLIISFTLQDDFGIPWDTTYRVGCAGACQAFIYKLGSDYRGERWPRISFWVALLVNLSLFFTPLVNRPTSRGELMLFALPDAVIVLVALIVSYRVEDAHQRAMRQQMILGLVVAVVFCAALFTAALMGPHPTR